MATVALVSVTLNAVNPMTGFLRKADPALKIDNYLDGHLMEKVRHAKLFTSPQSAYDTLLAKLKA